MNYSIFRTCALMLGTCLLLSAAVAEARPPWVRHGVDAGRGAPRWQAAPALGRILAQSRERMSNAERERLRHDLSAGQRDRGRDRAAQRDSRRDSRMTPQQRESLRRDMRDANRRLDRNDRRGNGKRGGNGERGRR